MENRAIEKAEYLKETKHLIRQALQEQGADISDTDPFRVFASIISQLETGSGDDVIKTRTGEEIANMTPEENMICICTEDYSYTDHDGILVKYERGVVYEVTEGIAIKLLFDEDTLDYREFKNRPSINGVELINNKSLTELGIQPKGDYALKKDLPRNVSELENDAGYLTEYIETDPTVPEFVKNITEEEIEKWNTPFEELDPTVPEHVKNITEEDIENWNTEEDPTVPQHVKDITEQDIENWNAEETDPTVPSHVKTITQDDIDKWNTSDYNDQENKPKINNIELSGNKSLDDLGIQPKGSYLTSETDPVFKASPASSITQADITKWNNNSGGGIAEESDPTVPQHVKNITEADITKWNEGANGIIEESDPTVPQHVKDITQDDIDKWNSGTGGGGSANIDISEEQNNGTYMWKYTSKDITVTSKKETVLPMDTVKADTSNGKLISEGNMIRIGPGVKQLLVITKWNTWTPGCSKYIYLYKNDEIVETASFYNYIWTANLVTYVDVTEGDTISVNCYHDYSGSISISSNYQQTCLKAIIIDETVSVDVNSDPLPIGTVIEYEGDEIPDGYIEVEDNDVDIEGSTELSTMTVILKESVTYTAPNNYARYVLPMILSNSTGSKFTIDEDGGVVVGPGLSKVKINGMLSCNEQNSGYVYGVAIVNQDGTESGTSYRTLWTASDNRIDQCIVSDRIVDVKEGDKLYLELYIDANGRNIALRPDSTYFTVEEIPDTVIYQQSLSTDTGTSTESYSTEEQLVGVWIDGKPIYRKVIVVENSSTSTELTINHGIENLNEVVDVRGSIRTYNSWKVIPTIYTPDMVNYNVSVYSIEPKGTLSILVGKYVANEKGFDKAYIIPYYTKTTD